MKKKSLPPILILLPVCFLAGYLCFGGLLPVSFDLFREACSTPLTVLNSEQRTHSEVSKSGKFMDPMLIENELLKIDQLKNESQSYGDFKENEEFTNKASSLQDGAANKPSVENTAESSLSDVESHSEVILYYLVMNQST